MLPLLRLLLPLVRWWHRGAGGRALTEWLRCTSCACARVLVHVCVCPGWQAGCPAVCGGLFDTLVSVEVLARSRIIFHPSQCAAVVDVHCATAGSRDRVAYSTQWIAINFNLQ